MTILSVTTVGGKRARVLLAMVLEVDPPALLADDPAASLAAQTAVILGSPLRTIGIVVGSFLLGTLLGFLACRLMRPLQAKVFMAPSPRYAA
jgi:ABC-type ATPase involved in cell division